MSVPILLTLELNVKCPKCGQKFDLMDWEEDGYYVGEVFGKDAGAFSDEIECPHCIATIEIKGVEF